MTRTRLYNMLADAFRAEGVRRVFALMGDGNMHWVTAMAQSGADIVHVRHEHCACAMAIGHYSASGEPGVASVTCGPGFTQITTALVSAVRGGVPMVIFAGESPIGASWHNHAIDQAAIASPTGAHYIRAHSPKLMADYVNEAFFVARRDRRPVVVGVPYDLQQQEVDRPTSFRRSIDSLPTHEPIAPSSRDVEIAALALRNAERPIILAGRGAMASQAGPAIERLAQSAGALLATTLPVRGLFDHDPYSMGVSGGFCTPTAARLGAQADLLVAFGAGLNAHTVDGGRMFPGAPIIQVDKNPRGLRLAGDVLHIVQADARLAAEAVAEALVAEPRKGPGFRTEDTLQAIASSWIDEEDFHVREGELDPRRVIEHLDAIIPKDWDIVSGSGHSSYFYSHMKDRRPDRFHVIREFGAIGNAISIATGVAAERGDGKVVLIEGDGGFIMHVQELETLARQGIKLLACIMNDGAYGAEIHKLRADGVPDSGAIFGRPDFDLVARGFGLGGNKFERLEPMGEAFADYLESPYAHVWNIHISRDVVSPRMRTFNARKH